VDVIARSLEGSAKNLNRELLAAFKGNAEAAADAVEQLVEEPEMLSAWATRMLRSQAEDKMKEEYTFFALLVDANMARPEGKQKEGLDYGWLSAWARTEREALDHIEPFSFEQLPAEMRPTAARGMAMAYLVETAHK
jgi:hypothetical protein